MIAYPSDLLCAWLRARAKAHETASAIHARKAGYAWQAAWAQAHERREQDVEHARARALFDAADAIEKGLELPSPPYVPSATELLLPRACPNTGEACPRDGHGAVLSSCITHPCEALSRRPLHHEAGVKAPVCPDCTALPDLHECVDCSSRPGSTRLCERCVAARLAAGPQWLGPILTGWRPEMSERCTGCGWPRLGHGHSTSLTTGADGSFALCTVFCEPNHSRPQALRE